MDREGEGNNFIFMKDYLYSSPSLIRPPYLPRNCGHIREVAFGEEEKLMHFTVAAPNISDHIREGGLC